MHDHTVAARDRNRALESRFECFQNLRVGLLDADFSLAKHRQSNYSLLTQKLKILLHKFRRIWVFRLFLSLFRVYSNLFVLLVDMIL